MTLNRVLDQTYELAEVDRLVVHPENPRVGDVEVIAASIDRHGFYGSVIAQRSTGHVLAGNHRLLAAQQQGIRQLPVIWVDVDDDQARRILLVDNRAAERARWDYEELASVLTELTSDGDDLAGLGWEPHELEALLAADWSPPVADDTLDDYGDKGARRSLTLSVDAWVVVDEAVAEARQRGDHDLTEEQAVVAICRGYLGD